MSIPSDSVESLREQILQLQQLHESGALQSAQYQETRAALEKQLIEVVLRASSSSEAAGSATTRATDAVTTRSSHLTLIAVAAGIVMIAALGYFWKAAPPPSADDGTPHTDAQAPHPTDTAQMSAMVERLAERLKSEPDNIEGWSMLGRSYVALGRKDEAIRTYTEALRLHPDDADLMSDYADTLAALNEHRMGDESMKWVQRALNHDPYNVKGLALAGTYAFDHGDFKGAAKYWQTLQDHGPAGNDIVRQMAPGLAEAREKAGLPALPTVKPASASGTISGTVTLSKALMAQVSPDDTVFVYARNATGGARMPLAILRRKVHDLPLQFTLDDSSAMSPAARLSSASSVIVEARVSRSGNAMPQPGDLRGSSTAVAPGSSAVVIDITDRVAQ